ncbi:amidohydrolase family protein [Nonomuraea sp. NPDC050790]|uniref:amidohydrolase n=1 Tax=Nonomuraea sp. NPDC050790 TaxID=3364371 RepID=UPI0037AFCDAF
MISKTLTRARLAGGELVDIVLRGGLVADVRPSGAVPHEGVALDLDGRVVMPGLWDHHVHFDMWALKESRLDVSAARSAAECAALVERRLRERPPEPGATLVGTGFQDGTWPDSPTAESLDARSGAVPVVLISHDIHCAWLNTAALRRWEVRSDGLVREEDCYALVARVNDLPDEHLDALAAESVRRAHARGVVGIVEFERRPNLDAWERRVRSGVTMRVACGVYTDRLDDAIERGLATGDVLPGTRGLVEMGSFKIVVDGSLNTRTAWCHDAFPGLGGEGAFGVRAVGDDELRELVARAHAAGIASAIHAIGDRANTLALDTFERTGARGTVEHAQLLTGSDLGRFARLGVAASVQPRHVIDDRDVADRHWAGRTERAFPLASLLSAGARVLLGSDAPVAPLDPWVSIASAVSRAGLGQSPWHPEQRISVGQALRASTRHPRLAPGVPADLVVLAADPHALGAQELAAMPVEGTLIAGEPVYGAAGRLPDARIGGAEFVGITDEQR